MTNSNELEHILMLIQIELNEARKKFPNWPTDPVHAAAVVAEEAGELVRASLEACYEPDKGSMPGLTKEAIQTAAMCVRFLLSWGDYEFKPGDQKQQ